MKAIEEKGFDKINKATFSALMKDHKKEDLQNILQYHTTLGVLKPESFKDGQSI